VTKRRFWVGLPDRGVRRARNLSTFKNKQAEGEGSFSLRRSELLTAESALVPPECSYPKF